MTAEMTGRERISLALQHRAADRVGVVDGLWPGLLETWRREGFPPNREPDEVFGFDMTTIRPDISLRLPTAVLEETPEYVISRSADGATIKQARDGSFPAGAIDHTIKTRADWETYRERAVWDRERVDWPAVRAAYARARARGQFVVYGGALCWDAALPIVGTETLLRALVEDPDWVRDMYRTLTDICLAGAEELLAAGFEFDGAFLCDDMGGRTGPLFSPRTYDALFFPEDRRVCSLFAARGIPVILHSCGNIQRLIPRLIEAGYTGLNPLEVKAGMDLVALKKQYGAALAFMGGIDARLVIASDPREIEHEIASKVPIAMQGGGYIYALDGPVLPGTALERYHHVLDLVRRHGTY